MTSIIIKESQLVKLLETAMDLDIYVQPVNPPIPGGNDNVIDTLEELRDKAKEIVQMAENGIKIRDNVRRELFQILDMFNKTYDRIKYIDKSELLPKI